MIGVPSSSRFIIYSLTVLALSCKSGGWRWKTRAAVLPKAVFPFNTTAAPTTLLIPGLPDNRTMVTAPSTASKKEPLPFPELEMLAELIGLPLADIHVANMTDSIHGQGKQPPVFHNSEEWKETMVTPYRETSAWFLYFVVGLVLVAVVGSVGFLAVRIMGPALKRSLGALMAPIARLLMNSGEDTTDLLRGNGGSSSLCRREKDEYEGCSSRDEGVEDGSRIGSGASQFPLHPRGTIA